MAPAPEPGHVPRRHERAVRVPGLSRESRHAKHLQASEKRPDEGGGRREPLPAAIALRPPGSRRRDERRTSSLSVGVPPPSSGGDWSQLPVKLRVRNGHDRGADEVREHEGDDHRVRDGRCGEHREADVPRRAGHPSGGPVLVVRSPRGGCAGRPVRAGSDGRPLNVLTPTPGSPINVRNPQVSRVGPTSTGRRIGPRTPGRGKGEPRPQRS